MAHPVAYGDLYDFPDCRYLLGIFATTFPVISISTTFLISAMLSAFLWVVVFTGDSTWEYVIIADSCSI